MLLNYAYKYLKKDNTMYRFLFRFVVTTLTILIASLLTNAIGNFMISYKNSYKPLTFTLLGMAINVIIFYPLFIKLENWITDFSVRIIRSGSSLAGKYLGLLITFTFSLFVLLYFYAKLWYGIDLFSILLEGRIKEYF